MGILVASSNYKQNNCYSLYYNHNSIRPKKEISGVNHQLISSSKSNNIKLNDGWIQEIVNRKKNKNLYSCITKVKYKTEETINKKLGII